MPSATPSAPVTDLPGIRIDDPHARPALQQLLHQHALDDACTWGTAADTAQVHLNGALAALWTPDHDTLGLAEILGLGTPANADDLEREVLVAMLAAPVCFAFASCDELVSAVRMRRRIAQAASRTALAFDTQAAERPEDDWVYDDPRGFLLRPGRDLIDALRRATQPEVSGHLFSFSCYRATEYVMLLGIAEELRECHPELLAALEHHTRHDVIRSASFHDVFLTEYGSAAQPLPPRFYVPGDRLWFRNPDERSADVTGFEGSWVLYMGGGLFSNFWQRGRPFTLTSKALEIFHWRHGVVAGADGAPAMDETIVAERVAASLEDPAQVAAILQRMVRMRDPKGVYAEGGCIDTTREHPRPVRPGSAHIQLPPLS
jgi:hypothetical protein